MGDGSTDLENQAREFAGELTGTVRALVPNAAPFRASASGLGNQSRLFIRQDPSSGILLAVGGNPMLRLEVSMRCVFDHRESYLAVEDSKISVTALAGSHEPLFRYEYVRNPTSGIPCAHVQVHAHRDAVTYVMSRSGDTTRRGQRRRAQSELGERVPQLADLHLPLGGARFRPCLEDVLEVLMDELGVDAPVGSRQALAEGRARWRRKQLGAAVRDAPKIASQALVELGYHVLPPNGVHPAERQARLHNL